MMYGVLTLTMFSIADMPSREIVFTDSSLSLWAGCYQKPGDEIDCSST